VSHERGGERAGARVTTRTGDSGETSLFGPGRVRKTDPRIEALGDLDEAQAALGVARAALAGDPNATVLELQRGLYVAMSEVATPTDRQERLPQRIDAAAVATIDALAARLRAASPVEGRFVIPGDDARAAALDLARTIVRRAERRIVALVDTGAADGTHVLPWLNRLSDVVFLLARAAEAAAKRD
jgi:cob(I)alamin adenosyltransferase